MKSANLSSKNRLPRVAAALSLTVLLAGQAHAQAPVQPMAAPAPAPAAAALAPAAATVISTERDWRLVDLGTSCIAETAVTVDGVNHHLEVRVQKAPTSPLEVTISSEIATSPIAGFKASLDRARTQVYSFAKLSGNGVEEVYWNIPRGSEALISYLKREMKFETQTIDSTGLPGKVITFSLRGSSATITKLGRSCAAGLSVPTAADMAFERAFLPQAVATVDVARITPSKADSLRGLLSQARQAFLDSAAVQSDIERLNAQYLSQINELAGLRRNLDRLTQQEITRLENARAAAQVAISTASTEINQLKPQVGTIEGQLVTANAEYEVSYNNIKPHLTRYNNLIAAVQSAESREDDAQSRLSDAESRLSNAQSELASLEQEARSRRHEYSGAQSEAQDARNDHQQAGTELRRFDRGAELRTRLSRDGRIDSLEREVQQFDARIRAQQQALANQEAERNRLNGELQRCASVAGADCRAERHALTEAQRRFQEIRQGIDQLESNRSSKESEIQNVRRQIESEVDREYSQLQDRESRTRQRLNNAEVRLRDIEARIRSIEQSEIPQSQADVRRADSDHTSASSDLSSATRAVRAARNDLSSFKQSVGFDALQADLDRKLARVNSLKSDLAKVDREIKKREKIIRDSQMQLAQIAIDMERTLEQIKLKEARSVEVQRALQPYELEKTRLQGSKATSDQAFAIAQSQFAAQL